MGYRIGGDFSNINRDFEGDFECVGRVEIGIFCKDRNIIPNGQAALSDICRIVFLKHLQKDTRLTSWEERTLTEDQVKYASADAYLPLEIYNKFHTMPTAGIPLYSEAASNTYISIHPGTCKEPCAYGFVLSKDIIDDSENNNVDFLEGTVPICLILCIINY
jgi:hypothetical protein